MGGGGRVEIKHSIHSIRSDQLIKSYNKFPLHEVNKVKTTMYLHVLTQIYLWALHNHLQQSTSSVWGSGLEMTPDQTRLNGAESGDWWELKSMVSEDGEFSPAHLRHGLTPQILIG